MQDMQALYRNLTIFLVSLFIIVNMIAMKKLIFVKANSNNMKIDGTTESSVSVCVPRASKNMSFVPIINMEDQNSIMLQNIICEQPVWNCEIPRRKIILGFPIAIGKFGQIMTGTAYDIFGPGSKTTVALKFIRNNRKNVSQLINQMEKIKMIGKHKNIINFIGYCSKVRPPLIVLELAPFGNLRDVLTSNNFIFPESRSSISMRVKTRLSHAYQIAQGLEYIASQGFIHGDLSSRNILVGENYTMKITDFSSTRNINDKNYEKMYLDTRKLEIWMAPESLMYNIYDTRSEVWAYGILLWEIMFSDVIPSTKMSYPELVASLEHGKRWPKPKDCPIEIYNLMLECWNFRPELRPTLSLIIAVLDQTLSRITHNELLKLKLANKEEI